MRQLKFRQYINGQFYYWGYGVTKDESTFVSPTTESGEYLTDSEQFTGLTDLNGIKIYEGDILQKKWGWQKADGTDDLSLCRIVLQNSVLGLYWLDEHELYDEHNEDSGFHACWDSDSRDWKWNLSSFEVIGNIHENLDLLKGTK